MPTPSSCPDLAQLEQLVLGQVFGEEAETLDEHVARCAWCGEAVTGLTAVDPLVEAMQARTPSVAPVDRDVVQELIDRLKVLCPTSQHEGSADRGEATDGDTPPVGFLDDTPSLSRAAAVFAERTREVHGLLAPPQGPEELGRFGAYGVLRLLGTGGMGAVWLARQARPHRLVALKMLTASLGRRERLDRFRREAEVVARLQHPNVVAIYEVGEWQPPGLAVPLPYFTMEYVEGDSLAQKLAAAPLTAHAAAQLLEGLARAMHFAHERGVLHRDLKPANILLSFSRNAQSSERSAPSGKRDALRSEDSASRLNSFIPKISDFGLAKLLEEDSDCECPSAPTETGVILGTPGYMAPEQAGGSGGAVGPAADVYGLGAILYECLTGRPPFHAATPLLTLDLVRSQEAAPPRQLNATIPADLETICLACLRKSPGKRYASAAALADDLRRFLAGKPIVARPVHLWERAWLWARRQPAAAALVMLGLLTVFAAVAGVTIHNAKLKRSAEEARRGHDLADSRYQSARDTLGQMLNQLKAPQIADVPRLQELRLKLLEDALAFYRTALDKEDEPDPAIRRDAAFAYTETGATQYLLGKIDSACDCFRRAVELIEGLPTEDRDRKDCQDQLAICHSYLGAHAILVGQFAEAERHYLAERSVWAQLSRDEPGNADRQNELARTEHHLGRVFQSTKRWPEAHTHYHRAVEIRTRLVGEHPENENYQAQLAETCINLAVVLGSLNRDPEARSASEKAIGLLRTLVERHPENLEWKISLTGAYSNLGLDLKNEGKPREALKLLDRAVELIEEALRQEPRHIVARENAFNIHGARAQVHDSLKDWPAAVKDWERVIALDTRPNPWLRRGFRAVDLARMGDHARAAAEAKTLLKEPTLPDEAVFVLVVPLYALSIEPARKDVRLTADEQSRLAEGYAMQALSLLRRLQAKGYFQDSENAKKLASDSELHSLRGREDFQRVLKQVEARKK